MNYSKQISQIASKLISFKTLTDNTDSILSCFAFIKKLLINNTKFSFIEEEYDRQPILWIIPKKNFPKIFLVGHMDVVDGNEKQFRPYLKKGFLFGRGAYDMKTQNAILIALLQNIQADFGVVFTSDEETGKEKNGAWYIAQKLKKRAKLVIVPDGEHKLGITTRIKGMGEFRIVAQGKSARYSYPWRGKNPYPILMKFYLGLSKLFPNAKLASDANCWVTTYNLISFDVKPSASTPAMGSMDIIINYTPPLTKARLIQKLAKFAEKLNCKIEPLFLTNPYLVDPDNKDIKKFKEILDKEAAYKTSFFTMSATSDIRHFHEAGIPTILTRIDGAEAHGTNENANLKSAVILYRTLRSYLS